MNYTEVEAKVREATSDEAWGPTGSQMQELAQYTFTYEHYPEVMAMLWRRMLYDNRNNWRRVYKVDFWGSVISEWGFDYVLESLANENPGIKPEQVVDIIYFCQNHDFACFHTRNE